MQRRVFNKTEIVHSFEPSEPRDGLFVHWNEQKVRPLVHLSSKRNLKTVEYIKEFNI